MNKEKKVKEKVETKKKKTKKTPRKKTRKGFTLIEILAVIIIIGVIGIIGVTAVSNYIEDSRKSAFANTAHNYVEAARALKASDKLIQEPKNTEAVLIPLKMLELEDNENFSTPYGQINEEKSYVIIVNNNNKLTYYITLIDETGHALVIESSDNIGEENIQVDQNDNIVIKEHSSIKNGSETIEINGVVYKTSNKDYENSETILLDSNVIDLFDVEVEEGWTNHDKTIKIVTVNNKENYEYYLSDRSMKPLKSDSGWSDNDTYVKGLGTYYAFVKSETGEISDAYEVVIDKIDIVAPECELEAIGTMSTAEYFGSDVEIKFKKYEDVNTGNSTSGVASYGIGSTTGSKTTTLTTDNTTGITYTGHIVDKAGNTNTCSITVKRKANFTISYVSNGGSSCTDKAVVYDKAYGTLCSSTRVGYTFEGWYKESTFENKITSQSIFKNDVTTLYAKWTANKYTVTLNANGGTVSSTSMQVTYDSTYGTIPTPTRAGYIFNGWYTATSGGTEVTSTTKVTITAAQTLYARWTICAAGTYAEAGATSCTSCPSGYTSAAGATAQNKCYINVEAGKYIATANSSTKTSCVAGTYKAAHKVNYGSTSSCSTCAAGTYSASGAGSCTNCPSGYTSSAGATAQNKCYISVSAGKYIATSGASSATTCVAGTYKAAHTVNYGSTSSCSTCAAGTYSTAGSTSCTNCPSGYTSAAGATAQNKCYISISAGKYLATSGGTSGTNCAAGTYKAAHTVNYGSTSSCSTCAAGTYSTAGAGSCTNCPSGYTSAAGATAQNKCYISISAGKYLATSGGTSGTNCAAGTYKAAHTVNYGSTSSCSTCAAGTYSTAGAGSCTNCPSGYTSAAGATAQNKCYISISAGKYLATSGGTSGTNCAAGTYKAAHTVNYGSTSSCSSCPSGYTSAAGATAQNKCYVSISAGKYLATSGGTTGTNCAAGKYKGAHTVYYGSTSSCTSCPTGYTSAAGATAQSSCYISVAGGKYIATAGASSATNCSAGTYKGAHSVYYGSTSSCSSCWAGSYSSAGASSCTTCPSGQTSSAGASSCYATCTLRWEETSESYNSSCSGDLTGSSSGCDDLSTSGYSEGDTYSICSKKVFCKQTNGNYCYGTNSACSCYPTQNRYRKTKCTLVCD